jgi:ferredoxin
MIVADKKPFAQVKSLIDRYDRIMIAGCGACVTVCHTGGEAEVKTLASGLRIAYLHEGKEKEILEECVTRQCEPEFNDPLAQRIREEGVDAVLSLACGVGVNLLADALEDIPVFPGLNTTFYGGVSEVGTWLELCAGCGECILHLTGGICPISRCAKSIMNGPCGGSHEGKCELGGETACAWAQIIERMTRLGTLDQLEAVQPPRDWSTGHYGGPRRMVVEALQIDGDDT